MEMNFKFLCCPLFFMVLAIEVNAWGLAEPVPETFIESSEVTSTQSGTVSENIKKMEKKGKAMIISGSILVPIGIALGLPMLSACILDEIGRGWCEGDPEYCEMSESGKKAFYTFLILGLFEIVGIALPGILLIIFGARSIKIANRSSTPVYLSAITTVPVRGGAMLSLACQF